MKGDIYLLHQLLAPLIQNYQQRALLIHRGYDNLTVEQKANLPIRAFIYDQLRSRRCNKHRKYLVMGPGYKSLNP